MFCTALNYICMHILGVGPKGGQENAASRARKWIKDHGGVTSIPSWGKTYLAVNTRTHKDSLDLFIENSSNSKIIKPNPAADNGFV